MVKSNLPLTEKLAALPEEPGVYLFKDRRGRILYIGKAINLRNRVRSYFHGEDATRPWLSEMVAKISDVEVLTTRSEKEALILECNLIKLHRPPFNIRFKDDKAYPFLKVTVNEPFPALVITRQPKDDGARYFGPYPDGKALRETVELFKRIFGVRTLTFINERRKSGCPWKDTNKLLPRACLEYHLHRCLGPCVAAVSQEDYRDAALKLCKFLEGKTKEVIRQLEKAMWQAAEREDFEKAAKIRDQIRAIQSVTERQAVQLPIREDIDAYAFVSEMGLGCIQMLIVRGGMLIGNQNFVLRINEGQSASEVLGAFVKQRYSSGVQVPKIVLLPVELEDAKLISEWLSEKRGETVSVRTAKSKVLKDLIEIAERNAKQALREEMFREEQEKISREYALKSLQSHLNLPNLPKRIECYDISTTMGFETVGSMVVFIDGKPAKGEYRKFKIKGSWVIDEATGKPRPDDYAAMNEVLTRRFKNHLEGDPKFSDLPDLLLVDGGKGQLSVALKVLAEFDLEVPVAALAKEHELLYVPKLEAPIALPFNSPALHLLQRIRDEAHRFAVKFHRKRRTQKALRTILDEVPGIGSARKKALLQHFGSLEAMMKASVEELAKVPQMNRKVAKSLWQFLHQASVKRKFDFETRGQ
ncbi:MAG: excinuclease ABC subunit UvrC [Armatimonadetes bacterium]|nr:excinuclease ABC subunit UvrC [Armatimonadota bacterium]MDW8026829.1 excinuclease ABC subunit UvrC [Armatimonadota bacterium]